MFIPSGCKLSHAVGENHGGLVTLHVLLCRFGIQKEVLHVL